MFDNARKALARLIRPKPARRPADDGGKRSRARRVPSTLLRAGEGTLQTRMYQAARASRLTSGWATSTTSADSELISSLTNLRNRSRALVRDAAYAKRAKVIVQNNVVGAGIGMQAQVMSSRDVLRGSVNDAIEQAWREWACAEYCHTGGTLHFCDLERALMGQVFDAGEIFVRKHQRAFGGSPVPFALEMIEPERIADEFMSPVPPGPAAAGAMVKMGIEVDRYGRPLAYWIRQRHPGELRGVQGETDKIERVPADQIHHLRLVDRWPQTRGEPWLHAVARKLNDMDGYSEAEIVAARGAANYVNTITTPEAEHPLATPVDPANPAVEKEVITEPGMTVRLAAGEEMQFNNPSRPNTALDPFMRYMLREVAAGTGVSYESLSRDYSQSNYSSSRLALLDDRDLWRMLQQWFIRNFRLPLHKEWLQAAVLARAIPSVPLEEYAADPRKFEAVLFKPRGWSWVDPTKEVAAYKEAIKAGFTTVSDVISQTGGGQDVEDVVTTRERELKLFEQADLVFDTSPEFYLEEGKPAPAAPATPKQDGKDGKDDADPPDDEGKRLISAEKVKDIARSLSQEIRASILGLSDKLAQQVLVMKQSERNATAIEIARAEIGAISQRQNELGERQAAADKQLDLFTADRSEVGALSERMAAQEARTNDIKVEIHGLRQFNKASLAPHDVELNQGAPSGADAGGGRTLPAGADGRGSGHRNSERVPAGESDCGGEGPGDRTTTALAGSPGHTR